MKVRKLFYSGDIDNLRFVNRGVGNRTNIYLYPKFFKFPTWSRNDVVTEFHIKEEVFKATFEYDRSDRRWQVKPALAIVDLNIIIHKKIIHYI